MKHPMRKKGGYTLVELTLAMAIFSFMLLIISLAYLNLIRLYRASTAARDVQQNNRFVMEEITRVARSATTVNVASSGGSAKAICFGGAKQTIFYLDADSKMHELKPGVTVSDCGAPMTGGAVITSEDSRVARLEANSNGDGTVSVTLWMTSRLDLLDNSLPAGSAPACKSGTSQEFCAVNKLSTSVELRGNGN